MNISNPRQFARIAKDRSFGASPGTGTPNVERARVVQYDRAVQFIPAARAGLDKSALNCQRAIAKRLRAAAADRQLTARCDVHVVVGACAAAEFQGIRSQKHL